MNSKMFFGAVFFIAFAGFIPGQSVTVTAPNGNESWPLGTMQMITWETSGYDGNVHIELHKDGAKVGLIANKIKASFRQYKWEAGKCAGGTAAAGGGYRVWILGEAGSFKDFSDKSFTLAPAPVLQMLQAKPLPAAPLLQLQMRPLDQINVKKLPNPAAAALAYKIIKMNHQFSIEELRIIGTVENIGPAEFKYSGTATLYRGTEIAAQKSFAKLATRQSFTVEFSVREGFDFTSQGLTFPVDYLLKIAYAPGIQAKPEEIDGDMGNNEKKLPGITIAKDAYQTYAQNYRQQLAALINQHRQAAGLNPLGLDSCIGNAAQGHSEWMNVTHIFNHTGKNGSSHQQRCQWAGCSCSNENIYNGGMAPGDAFNAWKASPGHNAAMLGAFSKIGIGISGGWITADFD